MFFAALVSRSWAAPQPGHVHVRTASGLGPSTAPQALHVWLVGAEPVRSSTRANSQSVPRSLPIVHSAANAMASASVPMASRIATVRASHLIDRGRD